MKACDLLIKNCSILTPDFQIRENCFVAVSGGRITQVGDGAEAEAWQAHEVIDGEGNLVMPGFVDGHTHTCQQLLRGRTADEYPMIWTRFLVPFESSLSPQDVRASARLHCIEMIKAGITSFADAGGVHMDQVAEPVVETGIFGAEMKVSLVNDGPFTILLEDL